MNGVYDPNNVVIKWGGTRIEGFTQDLPVVVERPISAEMVFTVRDKIIKGQFCPDADCVEDFMSILKDKE